MNIIEIIEKKKNNQILTKEEIQFFIDGYLKEEIKDYQMSSLLMAIVINGMCEEETIELTKILLESGDKIDLSKIENKVVDKHSTGGVGDKISLVVGPLVAACDVNFAKMSGRGLGHTGGTIDKLESFKNFKTNITNNEFIKQVNEIGISIISQTKNLVPADKKIYALRDVTGTVSSIPLIASSIMSKKLASGADAIVIDVKVGSGALLKTKEEATMLANLMCKIGHAFNKKTTCLLTDMDQPLGYAIGNALEVQEAINCLDGNGPKDLEDLSLTIAAHMISSVKDLNIQASYLLAKDALDKKQGLDVFKKFIKMQHGDFNSLNISNKIYSLKSNKTGWITSIDAQKLGQISVQLGGGRLNLNDKVDHSVGILLNKKVGDYVLESEELLKVFYNEKDIKISSLVSCFTIEQNSKEKNNLILDIIT
ncbi:MAG: thymidine phosphorylase [Mycoplasmatota bacterium]